MNSRFVFFITGGVLQITHCASCLALLFAAFLTCSTTAYSTTLYVSNTQGSDTCTGKGSRDNPYTSVNCIHDHESGVKEIVFLPGVHRYFSTQRFRISGKETAPIAVRGDDPAMETVIEGETLISGSYLNFSDLTFTRQTYSNVYRLTPGAIVSVGGSRQIRFEGVTIRGSEGDWRGAAKGLYRQSHTRDCLKIAGGKADTRQIFIIRSVIADCGQDAIDITGRHQIAILDNHISRALQIQVKGGASDIVVSGNSFELMRNGIVSGGMNCIAAEGYCGDWAQQELPPEQRYQARQIIVRGNVFKNIHRAVIGFAGWREAYVYANVFERIGGAYFYTISFPSSVFWQHSDRHWESLQSYCEKGNKAGKECTYPRGVFRKPYLKLKTRSEQIFIYKNHDQTTSVESDFWTKNVSTIDRATMLPRDPNLPPSVCIEAPALQASIKGELASVGIGCSSRMLNYDADGDGIGSIHDNCPLTPNPRQEPSMTSYIGAACIHQN